MPTIFQLKIIENRSLILDLIESVMRSDGKGHICVIEGNVLTNAHYNVDYRDWINRALTNICDGSSIAKLGGLIRGVKIETYTGPELFIDCLKEKKYRSFFLGSSERVLKGLKSEIEKNDEAINSMVFMELPFRSVEGFDYESIGKAIDSDNPDIIWVSLGSPKQDLFIKNLMPHVNRGVYVGVGAAFNFYSGLKEEKRAPLWMRQMHLEWLYRSVCEPRIAKRAFRYLLALPSIVFSEILNTRKLKKEGKL